MNKYLSRGLWCAICGLALCALGYYLMDRQLDWYKPAMIIGVIVFGIGFLTILYSFIRKIERNSIILERKERRRKQ